ncbi:MAG: serine/threonine protein kinase [Deltaproteobacteria bacterium]|nr:serine/threonine protein kinase [Deltaproteobacteria bacterium]
MSDDTQRYRRERRLGAGGLGVVYLARDEQARQRVALKTLYAELVNSKEVFAKISAIARQQAALAHLSLCPLTILETETAHVWVRPFFPVGNLKTLLRVAAPLPTEQACCIVAQLCAALDLAHNAGLVHGALWPQNIVLTSSGRALLMDFGGWLGQAEAGDASVRQRYAYRAPELLAGTDPGPATDVFGLATLLFEMLSGRQPFVGDTQVETVRAVEQAQVANLDGIPLELRGLLRSCLALATNARPATAGALLAELTALVPAALEPRLRRELSKTLRPLGGDLLDPELNDDGLVVGPAQLARIAREINPAPVGDLRTQVELIDDMPTDGDPAARIDATPNTRIAAGLGALEAKLSDSQSRYPTQEWREASAIDSASAGPPLSEQHTPADAAFRADLPTSPDGLRPPPAPPPISALETLSSEESSLRSLITNNLGPSVSPSPPITEAEDTLAKIFSANAPPAEQSLSTGSSPLGQHTRRFLQQVRRRASWIHGALVGALLLFGAALSLTLCRASSEPLAGAAKSDGGSSEALKVNVVSQSLDLTDRAPDGGTDARRGVAASDLAARDAAPLDQRGSPSPKDAAADVARRIRERPQPLKAKTSATRGPAPKPRSRKVDRFRTRIVVKPARANLYLDGQRLPRTTKSIRWSTKRRLAIVAYGYQIAQRTLNPKRPEKQLTINLRPARLVPPKAAAGTLRVLCRRKDRRRLIIDGHDSGKDCPRASFRLKSGRHSVVLYDPQTRRRSAKRPISLRKNRTTLLRITK